MSENERGPGLYRALGKQGASVDTGGVQVPKCPRSRGLVEAIAALAPHRSKP